MLGLPKEIQNQIYEEYFGSQKFDLVVEDISEPGAQENEQVTRLRRFPPAGLSLLLTCREMARNARNAHRKTIHGFTGRLVIRCTETRSVRCLKWFMGKCRPFLQNELVPDWVKTLTTTVAIPERWTGIHNGGEFFHRGIWMPLLELYPRMNALETICTAYNWLQPETKGLDLMLTETQHASAFYVFEIVGMTASIPIERRNNFKFIQSYLCGSYADRQPVIDGDDEVKKDKDGPPKQFAFSGEILNVWDLGDRPVSEKQRVIKMTDRIVNNVDANSAEPELSLVFRTSPFLSWSCKMTLEEEQNLDQVTCKIDEEFMRQCRERCWPESTGFHHKAAQGTPLQRKYSSWKAEAVLEAKREQLAQTLAYNLL